MSHGSSKSPDPTQPIRQAGNWAIVLGTLKLLFVVGTTIIQGDFSFDLIGLSEVDYLLTLCVGGVMVLWGYRTRNYHPQTARYLLYLIILCSLTLILAAANDNPAKIGIDAIAILVFFRARSAIKKSDYQLYVDQIADNEVFGDQERAVSKYRELHYTARKPTTNLKITIRKLSKVGLLVIASLVSLSGVAFAVYVYLENHPYNEPRLLLTRDVPSDVDAKIGWTMGDLVLKYGAPSSRGKEYDSLAYVEYSASNDWVDVVHTNRYYLREGEIQVYNQGVTAYGNEAIEIWFKQLRLLEDHYGPPEGKKETDEAWEAWWNIHSEDWGAPNRLVRLQYLPARQVGDQYYYDQLYLWYISHDFFSK